MSACIINESGNIFRNHSRSVIDSMQKPTGGTINTLPLISKHVARDGARERKKNTGYSI